MMKQQIELDNKIYEVIATVHDDDTNKDFVLFTSSKIDNNKGLTISCALYHEENGKIIPERITEKNDKEVAQELIEEVITNISKLTKKN